MFLKRCAFKITIAVMLLWNAPVFAQSLYWVDPVQVKLLSGETNGAGVPITVFDAADGVITPGPIALDQSNGFVYFTTGASTIKRGNINGAGTPITLFNATDGLASVHALAIDVAGNRIFWCEKDTKKIRVGNLDGAGAPTTLFDNSDDVGVVIDIALDIAGGFIYWADGTVSRGNIDGSGSPEILFGAGLPDPHAWAWGIDVDPQAGKVYWTMLSEGRIMCGNSDGSGLPIVLFDASNVVEGPFDIVHDPNNGALYWTSPFTGRIRSGSDDGVGPVTDLYDTTDGLTLPTFLAITDLTPPPLPPPYIPGQQVYWSGDDRIYKAPLDGLGTPTVVYSKANGLENPEGIVANFETGDLFWTQGSTVTNTAIMAGRMDGSIAPTVLFDRFDGAAVQDPHGIAADFTAGKLYWADSQDDSIRCGNIDGSDEPIALFSGSTDMVYRPHGLALDVDGGKIYWADRGRGRTPGFSRIAVGSIDGSGSPTVLFDDSDGLVEAYGIAIDVDAGLVYWSDYAAGKLQVGNIDGSGAPTDLYTVADGFVEPAGITLDNESGKLYICDESTGSVAIANSDGSGITELYGPADGLEYTVFAIVDNSPAFPFSKVGLPAASPKSLALSVTALMIAAITAILGAGVRRRRQSTYRTD